MIIECLKDMIAFLILITYVGTAFSFIVLNFGDNIDFVDCVKMSFLVALGDWDSDAFSLVE